MRDPLLTVALTGGIGTGKSYVAQRLRDAGLPTVDTDGLAREAVAPGSPGLKAVVERFGDAMLTPEGALDRARLGRHVFRDPQARADLEAIVHPEVRRRVTAWQRSLIDSGYRGPAIVEIPLVFETGRTGDFDLVVVVACDPATQRERVMARDGLSGPEADKRIGSQWPIDRKVRAADHVIRTDGTFEDTDTQVRALVASLLQRTQDARA